MVSRGVSTFLQHLCKMDHIHWSPKSPNIHVYAETFGNYNKSTDSTDYNVIYIASFIGLLHRAQFRNTHLWPKPGWEMRDWHISVIADMSQSKR